MQTIDVSTPQTNAFTWHVQYRDGSIIGEFTDDRPDGRGFAEIDATQVSHVGLSGLYNVAVPNGASPIFFRRRSVGVDLITGENNVIGTAHCIGWRDGKNAAYLFVFDDGSALLSNDLNAV